MIKPLEYYFMKKGIIEHVIFNKYTIDDCGVVRNKNTGKIVNTHKDGKYNRCGVYDNSGRRCGIRVCRAVASTFIGPPPSPEHTADHIDNKRTDCDALTNIHWLDKTGQSNNQDRTETYRTAIIVVRDGVEKTVKEWVSHLRGHNKLLGREYTASMINSYAQKKQHGFSYKEYPDLLGEVWKKIVGSETWKGRWEISNMSRVKYITKHVENVLSGKRIGLNNVGYPIIVLGLCHIIAFKTFFPEEYAAKKTDELVLHEDDDRLDFRPHKLRLGTQTHNTIDAHDNGKYDGTKTARMKCASYIDGVFEKDHVSQSDAATYLKMIGYDKAAHGNIRMVLSGDRKTAYGRTWKKI